MLAELEVVARLEVELRRLAVRAQRDEVVLAAGGHPVDDDVLDLREHGVGCLFGGGDRVLGGLDLLAQGFASATRAAFSSFGAWATRLP